MMVALWFDHSEWQDFLMIPNPENEPGIKFMRLARCVGAHEHAMFPILWQQRQFLLLAGFLIGGASAGRYKPYFNGRG
jgi:hypothetical protein